MKVLDVYVREQRSSSDSSLSKSLLSGRSLLSTSHLPQPIACLGNLFLCPQKGWHSLHCIFYNIKMRPQMKMESCTFRVEGAQINWHRICLQPGPVLQHWYSAAFPRIGSRGMRALSMGMFSVPVWDCLKHAVSVQAFPTTQSASNLSNSLLNPIKKGEKDVEVCFQHPEIQTFVINQPGLMSLWDTAMLCPWVSWTYSKDMRIPSVYLSVCLVYRTFCNFRHFRGRLS